MWIFIFLISNLVCRWQNTRAWINQACDISSPPKRLPGRLPREMDMFDNKEIFEYLPFHLPIFDRVSLKMQVMQVMTIENPGFPSLIAQLSIPSIRSIEEILQILTWNGKRWKSWKNEKNEESCQAGIRNKGSGKEQLHFALLWRRQPWIFHNKNRAKIGCPYYVILAEGRIPLPKRMNFRKSSE